MAAALAATAGCAAPVPQVLQLGATLPLSAPDPAPGAAWERGYRRAVDEANREGGVWLEAARRRTRVTLVVRDDGGELARAEIGARELIASGIHVLLATPGVVRMAAQAAVARRLERPYVVPAQAGPELLASERPWVLVAPVAARGDEETAYQTARAALEIFRRARTLEAEAMRRTFPLVAPSPPAPR
jgi:ABC-type branched-subunit amino acid transport system substrate-binding protein